MILKVMGSFTMGYSPTGLTLVDSADVAEPEAADEASPPPQLVSTPAIMTAAMPRDNNRFSFMVFPPVLLISGRPPKQGVHPGYHGECALSP